MNLKTLFAASLLGAVALVAGCNHTDPKIEALRQQFVLGEEPAGAASIAESIEKAPEASEVTVVGRIAAGEFEPWSEGQAAFLISEALPDAHASTPGHDPATCPFCRRRAEKAGKVSALVQFRDAEGKILPIDARELLGVEKDQVVVVRGKGQVDELGTLVVIADGIHVRR